MPFNRPIKVISSVAGGRVVAGGPSSGGGAVVIVNNVEPTIRDDGSPLLQGDFWWAPDDSKLYIRISDAWELPEVDTFHIELSQPLEDLVGNLPFRPEPNYPTDYPQLQNRDTQADANEFFLHADLWSLDKILEIQERLDNLGDVIFPFDYEFKADKPLYVVQQDGKASWSFDLDELGDISTSNPFYRNNGWLPSQERAMGYSIDIDGLYELEATLPVSVEFNGNEINHGFEIASMNDIEGNAPFMTTTGSVKVFFSEKSEQYKFTADAPVKVHQIDNDLLHTFMPSECKVLP